MTPLEILEARARLVGWSWTPAGANAPVKDYGGMPEVTAGSVWTTRDGQMAAAFRQSQGAPQGDLLTMLRAAGPGVLDVSQWLPPGGLPPVHVPTIDPACVTACAQAYPADAFAAAACASACFNQAEVPAATTTPQPAPRKSIVPWLFGGLCLGVGAIVIHQRQRR